MKKGKIILMAGCGLGGVLFLSAAFLLYQSVARFNVSQAELKSKSSELSAFYQEDPFPSRDNVKVEGTNAVMLTQWFDALMVRLSSSNISSQDRSPSLFKSVFGSTRSALKRRAVESGSVLPEDFAFGFSAYAGVDSPNPDNVPRLMEQLKIMSTLCEILYKNGVKSLTSIQRDEFESSRADSSSSAARAASGRRSSSRRRSRSPAAPAPASGKGHAVSKAGLIGEGALYGKYHFVVEFTCLSESLFGILNDLASCKMFSVVTSLKVTKAIPDLVPPAIEVPAENESSTPLPAAGRPEKKARQRRVCGPEMELPANVRIEIDVYKFKEESARAPH